MPQSYIEKIKEQIGKMKYEAGKYDSLFRRLESEIKQLTKKANESMDFGARKTAVEKIQRKARELEDAAQKRAIAQHAAKQLEEQLKQIKSGGMVIG